MADKKEIISPHQAETLARMLTALQRVPKAQQARAIAVLCDVHDDLRDEVRKLRY